jgi:hypothetical protein
MTDLTKYREIRRAKKILLDLQTLANMLSYCSASLKRYEMYVPIRNVTDSIRDNLTLINVYLKKYQKILDEG